MIHTPIPFALSLRGSDLHLACLPTPATDCGKDFVEKRSRQSQVSKCAQKITIYVPFHAIQRIIM